MKRKVQILMCGLLMICASFICVACGKLNFESDKIEVTNTTYTYDGNAHIFNVAYEGVDVEVTYSLDNETFVSKEELNVKEVGTHKIYYKLTAENYNDYIGSSDLVIDKAELNYDTININGLVVDYDGQSHTIDVSCVVEGVTITYSLDGINFGNKNSVAQKNAGTYKIYYKLSKPNYIDIIMDTNFVIRKVNFDESKISVARKTQTYSGNKEIFEVNYPEQSGISVLYSLDGENFVTFEQTNFVNAGTYTVYYKISNPNYNDYVGQTTFTINKASFDSSKVSVSNTTATYDGNAHLFDIELNGITGTITYSLDNKTFVNASELNLVNAGTYTVYYKVVIDNYEDYVGNISYTINSISLDTSKIDLGTTNFVYDGNRKSLNVTVEGITADVTYKLGATGTYTRTPYLKNVGEYTVYYKITTTNYTEFEGTMNVFISGVQFYRNTTLHVCDYATINDALDNLPTDGGYYTLKLYGDAIVVSTLNINYSVNIDGLEKYSIKASDEFTGSNLISVASKDNMTLTLQNITVDANSKARVVYVNNKNKLTLINANITGGYLANNYAPGVFITNQAKFVMAGGSIIGNRVADGYAYKDEYYVAYSQDLWIGANAGGNGMSYEITEGTVGKMFINANSWSAQNPGEFLLHSGNIESIYLEYDANYGATLKYTDGHIGKLLISTKTSGEYEEVTPVAETTYKGGIETTTANVATYDDFVNALNSDKRIIRLTANIDVESTLIVTRNVVLDMNGKTLSNTTDLYVENLNNWSLISVRENGSLKVTGNGTMDAKENDCYDLDVQDGANLTIVNGTFIGNICAVYVSEGHADILGGTYSIKQLCENGVETAHGQTINIKNENADEGTATVSITGGVFKNFDPAGRIDNPHDVLVADGYTAVLVEGSTTDYKVVKAN